MQKTPQLKVIDRFGVKRTIPIAKPEFTIGRRLENDLQIMSNSVSRYHGAIVCEDGVYYLVDKGSKSGIFINNERVERSALRNMDQISIGGVEDYEIQFIISDEGIGQVPPCGEQSPLLSGERRLADVANEELKNLARYVEVNQAFRFSLAPDDVLRLIVDAAIELAGAERGLIMLRNAAGRMEFKIARDHNRNDVARNDFALSTSVVQQVLKTRRTVVLNVGPESNDPRQSVLLLDLHTVIGVPLQRFRMQENMAATSNLQLEVIGILYLDSRQSTGRLSQTSLELLESLAFEASKSFENVRLMHEEREKQRLEREFQLAREVQVALSPAAFVETKHFEVAAHSLPCRYVAGDFYDLVALRDGRVVVTLADVSGKGVSAALLASMAQGVIEAQFYGGHTPSEVAGNLNRVIVNRSEANRFITMFCASLDSEGHLTWVNAGHNPSILVRASGRTETLSTKSLIVGAFDFAEYSDSQTQLGPGDLVFSFSDGVTEAVNSSSEMFGEQRLIELLQANLNLTALQLRDLVLEEVLSFTDGLPQGDDITVLALKMK
jgi:sigma-B regulation protein RsbU (phosphoserine phosphatase)